jgi:glycosyltransferase involved in cell wall biosynthesis
MAQDGPAKSLYNRLIDLMESKSRKILVITGAFPPMALAEADHIARLAAELGGAGYSVDILTSAMADVPETPCCKVHPVMTGWKWRDRASLRRFAREIRPDLIFIWFVGPAFQFHPMITFAASELKAALPGVRIITQVTAPLGARPKQFPLPSRLLLKAAAFTSGREHVDYAFGTLLRDSDRVVAMAGPHLKRLATMMPNLEAKSAIIPPPPLIVMSEPGDASRKRGREMLNAKDDDLIFVYFGRLYRGKGLESLLDAFADLTTTIPNARLAIIGGPAADRGDGWRVEDLYAQAERIGLSERISWSGEFAFDSDAGSLYLRAGDIAVLPFAEGAALNNSSLAAVAAHDLPVITTSSDHPERDLVDGENMLIIPPSNTGLLAEAMIRLAGDRDLQARLRNGVRRLAAKHFTWAGSVASTVVVIEDALGARTAA